MISEQKFRVETPYGVTFFENFHFQKHDSIILKTLAKKNFQYEIYLPVMSFNGRSSNCIATCSSLLQTSFLKLPTNLIVCLFTCRHRVQYTSLDFRHLRCNASPTHGSNRGVASVHRDVDVRPHAIIIGCVEDVEDVEEQTITETRVTENS